MLDEIPFMWSGRRTGKTLAYCIKLALSEGEPLNFKHDNLTDENHGHQYKYWFKDLFHDVWIKLKDAGFPVREVIWK